MTSLLTNLNDIVETIFREQIDKSEPVVETLQSTKAKSILLLISALMKFDYTQFILKRYNRELKDIPPGQEYPYYRENRYNYEKQTRCGRFKNSDRAVKYQQKQGNIFVDIHLNDLPRIESNGNIPWTSYNWVLLSNSRDEDLASLETTSSLPATMTDLNFSLIFARHTEWDSSEMGLKHSMLSLNNDIWACGEMRIFNIKGKGLAARHDQTVYQFNLNSSINSTPSISEMEIIERYQIPIYIYRKLIANKIRKIFENSIHPLFRRDSLVQSVEEEVMFNENVNYDEIPQIISNANLITTGITPHYGSIDPVHGLLDYYYRKEICPSESSVLQLNSESESESESEIENGSASVHSSDDESYYYYLSTSK